MNTGCRRAAVGLLVGAVASVFLFALPVVQQPVLRSMGAVLVHEDPHRKAEIVAVSVESGVAGLLAASDLVEGGAASRVLIFVPPFEFADRELARRGFGDESRHSRLPSLLRALAAGVPLEIELRSVSGTTEQGRLLRRICDASMARSVTVIASADHSRRVRRALERQFQDSGIEVGVYVTPYSSFDPDAWWQTRDGVRTWIVEAQKLLLDVALHPLG